MIDRTFSFVRGLGPSREKELWRKDIRRWDDFPAEGVVLSPAIDQRVREALPGMRALVDAGDLVELAQRLPAREHWRLIPSVEKHATCLDIETTVDGRVTVVGVYDGRRGARLYVRGHNLGAFVDDPLTDTLVTFNGASFDVPVLRRTFPGWRPPPVHLDLCVILRRLGERGGLKAIETRWGLERPAHLTGVGGADAVDLWNAFARRRDVEALQRLCDYNLCDVVQLRSLAQLACSRLAERTGTTWQAPEPFLRGDVLYDLTKLVESVVKNASRIVPDLVHDEERIALRA